MTSKSEMFSQGEYQGTPVIAFANGKGGVARTTSCANIGAALAQAGARVLCLDLDPQAALTAAFGVDPEEARQRGLHRLLASGEYPLEATIVSTDIERLDIIPTCLDLSETVGALAGDADRESKLRSKLMDFFRKPQRPGYDLLLLDCPASLGLLTANALTAATHLIVPVTARLGSLKNMATLGSLVERLHTQRNATVKLLGILVTMFDINVCLDVTLYHLLKEKIESQFGDYLFSTLIGQSVAVGEAEAGGLTVVARFPESLAAAWYRTVAEEVLERLRKDAVGVLGAKAESVAA